MKNHRRIITISLLLLATAAVVFSLPGGAPADRSVFPEANVFLRPLGTVLIISTTLVAIAVPLTASIYTPKLIDLFLADRFQWLIYGYFFFANITVVLSARLATDSFGHSRFINISTFLAVSALALFIPYCRYILHFLDPGNIVCLLRARLLRDVENLTLGGNLTRRQDRILHQVENLASFSLRSVERSDMEAAQEAFWSFRTLLERYAPLKKDLGEAWFIPGRHHFPTLPLETIQSIEDEKLVLEAAVLLHTLDIFRQTIGRHDDEASACAVLPRKLARLAMQQKDPAFVNLVLRHYHTCLRVAILGGNFRISGQLFRQYSLLAAELRDQYPDSARQAAGFIAYYAVRARDAVMPWIYAAALCELAELIVTATADSDTASAAVDALLNATQAGQRNPLESCMVLHFLHARLCLLNRNTEAATVKAQIQTHQPEDSRLACEQLLAIRDARYWEFSDREETLFWLEPAARQFLV